MNKIKLLISILLLLLSSTMFTIGAIFVTQNIGMIALIIFGGVGVIISFAFLEVTMSDSW